jgi:hypothetical protein
MNNFKLILILIICLLISSAAVAENKASLDLGIAGMGARPTGMGRSFVSIADDANAIFQNPAGLGFMKTWGATSMSTRLLNRADYKLLGLLVPTNMGTIGLGYIGMNTPAGYLTTDRASLATATPISYGSSMLVFSYGYDMNHRIEGANIGHMAIGANLKFINNSFSGVDEATGSGLEADLGVIIKPNDEISLGASLQNVWMGDSLQWASGTKEDVPATIRLGASFLALKNLLVSLDTETPTSNRPILFHGGVEWTLFPILALRAGLDQDPTGLTSSVTNMTAGIGITVGGFRFDYAYRADALQAANNNHYLSLSFMPPTPKIPVGEQIASEKEVKVANVTDRPAPVRKVRSYDEIMKAYRASQK